MPTESKTKATIMFNIDPEKKADWKSEAARLSAERGHTVTLTDFIIEAVEERLNPKVRIVTTVEASSPDGLERMDMSEVNQEVVAQMQAAARVTPEEIKMLLQPDETGQPDLTERELEIAAERVMRLADGQKKKKTSKKKPQKGMSAAEKSPVTAPPESSKEEEEDWLLA